jgi:hypothetical protein
MAADAALSALRFTPRLIGGATIGATWAGMAADAACIGTEDDAPDPEKRHRRATDDVHNASVLFGSVKKSHTE